MFAEDDLNSFITVLLPARTLPLLTRGWLHKQFQTMPNNVSAAPLPCRASQSREQKQLVLSHQAIQTVASQDVTLIAQSFSSRVPLPLCFHHAWAQQGRPRAAAATKPRATGLRCCKGASCLGQLHRSIAAPEWPHLCSPSSGHVSTSWLAACSRVSSAVTPSLPGRMAASTPPALS